MFLRDREGVSITDTCEVLGVVLACSAIKEHEVLWSENVSLPYFPLALWLCQGESWSVPLPFTLLQNWAVSLV